MEQYLYYFVCNVSGKYYFFSFCVGRSVRATQIEGVSIRSGKGCCCRPERYDLYIAYWSWKVTYIPASSLLRLIESIYLQRMRSMGDIHFFVCRSRIIPEPPFPSQGIAGSGNEIVIDQCCQVWDFIPTSWDFLSQLGCFLDFYFKNLISGFFWGVFRTPSSTLANQIFG